MTIIINKEKFNMHYVNSFAMEQTFFDHHVLYTNASSLIALSRLSWSWSPLL